MATIDTNCSNDNLTSEDINIRLRLYDGTGIADWFIDNVVSADISTEDAAEIKKNFPRANYIQWIVDRVSYSMPPFEVVFSPKEEKFKSKIALTGDAAVDVPALQEEEDAFKRENQMALDARREKIEEHIREIQERQCWEGEKDFWASVPIWRAFLLVCGDTFVKLPWAEDLKGVAPERMGPQWTMIQLSIPLEAQDIRTIPPAKTSGLRSSRKQHGRSPKARRLARRRRLKRTP